MRVNKNENNDCMKTNETKKKKKNISIVKISKKFFNYIGW